jgi:hypothetical protein
MIGQLVVQARNMSPPLKHNFPGYLEVAGILGIAS